MKQGWADAENIFSIVTLLLMGIASVYVLCTLRREKKEKASVLKSSNFIEQQMWLYLACSVSWMIMCITVAVCEYDKDVLTTKGGNYTIIIILSLSVSFGMTVFTLGIWQFAYQNWIASR